MLMEIFTFYIFLFLHKQKGHSVLVGRILEAEEKPWTEQQDTPQSTQPEHLRGLEGFCCSLVCLGGKKMKHLKFGIENKSVIKCYR